MAGLATHTDVASRYGAADGLMRHPDEGGSFVDLEGDSRLIGGGINEVICVCFHGHKKTPTCSREQKYTHSLPFSYSFKSLFKIESTRRQADLKVDGSSY